MNEVKKIVIGSVCLVSLLAAGTVRASVSFDGLAAAVADAAEGAVIELDEGVYTISAELVVDRGITVKGAGIYMSGGRVERAEILNNRLVHNSGAHGSYSDADGDSPHPCSLYT